MSEWANKRKQAMDDYILMLVLFHTMAESPQFFRIYVELWSTPAKDESHCMSIASREVKTPTLIT